MIHLRRFLPLAIVAAPWIAEDARAAAGTAYSETSSTASLANAVSARGGNAGTMAINPAGLGDVREPELSLSGQVAHLDASYARTGEASQDLGRTFGSASLAVATPLPGLFRRVGVGAAFDVPAEHVLKVDVPVRLDQPISPLYGARPDRISAWFGLGYAFASWLRVGMGLALTPSLNTPTEVTYVAGRDPSVDKSVVVRLDRSLSLASSFSLGLRAIPTEKLALSLSYRDKAFSRATGSQRTVAGGVLASDPIDFYEFWDPAEITLGGAWKPVRALTLSTDLVWHRWSEFRSGFDGAPSPVFKDTGSVHVGAEVKATRFLLVRGGWAVEPSPIPEQVAETNYLGSDALVLALGAGVDLRPVLHVPIAVDLHLRTRLGGTQTAHKDPSQLPDSNADLPGKQIDNLGYPGFSSHASLYQAGLTVTFFLAKESP